MVEALGNTLNSSYRNVTVKAGTSNAVEKMKKDIESEKKSKDKELESLLMGLGVAALILLFFGMTQAGNK